jgi:hypothetical protein
MPKYGKQVYELKLDVFRDMAELRAPCSNTFFCEAARNFSHSWISCRFSLRRIRSDLPASLAGHIRVFP